MCRVVSAPWSMAQLPAVGRVRVLTILYHYIVYGVPPCAPCARGWPLARSMLGPCGIDGWVMGDHWDWARDGGPVPVPVGL